MPEQLIISTPAPANRKLFYLLVGGYGAVEERGIESYIFDAKNGMLTYLNQSQPVDNPSYLCCDTDSELVYVVSENENGSNAHAFSVSRESGMLAFINKEPLEGAAACYVSINKGRNHIFIANYKSGSLSVLPLNTDGSLLPLAQHIQDEGSSLNTERQDGPHVHAALLSPDEKYLLYTDLGTDEIYCYRYNAVQKAPLSLHAKIQIKPGSGPRHFVFSNDGRRIYLVTELSAEVLVLDFSDGSLNLLQTISMVAEGFGGERGGGDIRLSADDRLLYATNRGDANEIVVFSVNQEDGRLHLVQRCSSMGLSPRNLAIDPTGSYLLAANQDDGRIVVFKLDNVTGKIGDVVNIQSAEKPSCLIFFTGSEA